MLTRKGREALADARQSLGVLRTIGEELFLAAVSDGGPDR
jgi:hypothetical protein